MHKFFEQEFDCFGRYARSHQSHWSAAGFFGVHNLAEPIANIVIESCSLRFNPCKNPLPQSFAAQIRAASNF